MSDPLVSIVMPVYNAGIPLKDAIRDVLNQSYRNIELICIDDGSTDQSRKILQFYSELDKRVKILHQENKGAGAARNLGMDYAGGDFFLFLDADDRFSADMVLKTVALACSRRADIVIYDAFLFDSKTRVKRSESWVFDKKLVPKKEVFSHKDCPDKILQISALVMWNKLISRDLCVKSKARFQEIPYNNDSLFAGEVLMAASRIAILDEKLIYYRTGNMASVSLSALKRYHPEYSFVMLDAVQRMLCIKGYLPYVYRSMANFAISHICSHINNINEKNYNIFLKWLDSDLIDRLQIGTLKKDEYSVDSFYEDIQCLVSDGGLAFICRNSRKIYEERCNFLNLYERQVLSNKSNDYIISYSEIPVGSNVIIFGAGKRGKQTFALVLQEKKFEIVAWIDTHIRSVEINGDEVVILKPGEIMNLNYDYVIIAVDSVDIMIEIRKLLIGIGVRDNAIIW